MNCSVLYCCRAACAETLILFCVAGAVLPRDDDYLFVMQKQKKWQVQMQVQVLHQLIRIQFVSITFVTIYMLKLARGQGEWILHGRRAIGMGDRCDMSSRIDNNKEGLKLLGTWLQGDRALTFCRLLARNTAKIKPGHLPGSVTWPFLILAVAKCVILDISGKKRGATKSAAARMLRVAVQCAEDVRLSGHSLLLISVAKQLFSHIWEVLKDAPSFQLDYSIILRQLVTVKEYQYQMKPRTYSSFVMLYTKKVATSFDAKLSNQASSKEESFRCTLTLHILLENPPGDYPDIMREEVLIGFCSIFSHIREEGKLTRKLMECINPFLLKDGPNLGYKSVEIHNAVQGFIFHSWLTTHDQALKSLVITYAEVQLKLGRAISKVLENLLDVIIKELDQTVNTGAGLLWCEAPRDEKAGSLRCFQEELMDLSATVFYLAYKCTPKAPNREKRLRTEHVMTLIMDGLLKESLFWLPVK